LKKFIKTKLDWSFKVIVTKVPPNWEDQGIKMVHRVAYLVKTYYVPTSFVVNTYKIRICIKTYKWGNNMGKEGIKRHICSQG